MDTNAPDDDHWWFRLSEQERPNNWEFFTQPPGLLEHDGKWETNPKAENIKNLPDNYYLDRAQGKSRDYILVYYCNQYGFVQQGKPVYPEYLDHIHCAGDHISPVSGRSIVVGIDFGLTPAAVFGQQLPNGRWIWFDELVTDDMGTVRFGELLGQKVRSEYGGFEFLIVTGKQG